MQIKFHVLESSRAYDIRRERSRLTESARDLPRVQMGRRGRTRVAESARQSSRCTRFTEFELSSTLRDASSLGLVCVSQNFRKHFGTKTILRTHCKLKH